MAQILLGGSIGVQGTQSVLGNITINFPSDANYTLTAVQWANKFLEVTGTISATRNLIAPLNQGQEYVVQNNTTGGYSIQIIGSTGIGITVANGATVSVVCDGTNYLEVSGGGGSVTLSGDVIGPSTNTIVTKIQGNSVESQSLSAGQNGYVMTWNNSAGYWQAAALANGSANFYINSFSIDGYGSTQVVEYGQLITPSFTASYSTTPLSAQITDSYTSNTENLTTPFTSITLGTAYSPDSSSPQAITFTLTAVSSSSTLTSTAVLQGAMRSYGGIGTNALQEPISGSGTSYPTTPITVTLTGYESEMVTLNSLGVYTTDVGNYYGPFSPTNQKIYLLLPHTATPHTFRDQNGFAFVMDLTYSFGLLNQHGEDYLMDVYQSTNFLSTPFTIKVES